MAMHYVLNGLQRCQKVIYIAPTKALAIYFVRWVRKRLNNAEFEDALKLIRIVYPAFREGLRQAEYTNPEVKFNTVTEGLSWLPDLIVVDEAHYIFGDHGSERASFIKQTFLESVQFPAVMHLLLSDNSQHEGRDLHIPGDNVNVVLNEVVRSSKRIADAAHAYELERSLRSVCHHCSQGPKLHCRLFETGKAAEEKVLEMYAHETLSAIAHIKRNFKGLALDNRVAILVPNEKFRSSFKRSLQLCLQDLLKDTSESNTRIAKLLSEKKIELIDAVDAVSRPDYGDPSDEIERIILSSIDGFAGLERSFVVAVDLDSRISKDEENYIEGISVGENAGVARCNIYRALTRAHFWVAILNREVEGGYLEFLAEWKERSQEESDFHHAEDEEGLSAKISNMAINNIIRSINIPFSRTELRPAGISGN